jgi:hypothetical protein
MTLALDTEIYGQIETRIDLWCLLLLFESPLWLAYLVVTYG